MKRFVCLWKPVVLLLGIGQLGGCAYLTTYTRNVALDGKNSVSVDVKQRLVLSSDRETFSGDNKKVTNRVICAEPSPDALTVLGVASGLSLSDAASQKALGASLGLSESGGSIGLRTQSIQLLRDSMYRLCEGYASGAVSDDDFASMQRRYQSTMMGLIAIEQLTGPVKASQLALRSQVQAGTGGSSEAIDAAQKRADDAETKLGEAETAVLVKQKAQVDAQAAQDRKKKEHENAETAAKAKLAGELEEAKQTTRQADIELAQSKKALARAEANFRDARSALQRVQNQTVAGAGGHAELESVARSQSDISKELGATVASIVQEINFSYLREGCMTVLTRSAADKGKFEANSYQGTIVKNCQDLFTEYVSGIKTAITSRAESLKTLRETQLQSEKNRGPSK